MMAKKSELDRLAQRLRGAARDAVKLVWMEALDLDALGRLDLSLVAEMERKGGGTRVKLVDQGAMLAALVQAAVGLDKAVHQEEAQVKFFAALTNVAQGAEGKENEHA